MLDFYLLKDEQRKPSYPEEAGLEFVGELDDLTFGNLQSKKIIDERFEYYSDFILDTSELRQIRKKIIEKQLQYDSDVKVLTQLLDIAESEQSGLIAFGD